MLGALLEQHYTCTSQADGKQVYSQNDTGAAAAGSLGCFFFTLPVWVPFLPFAVVSHLVSRQLMLPCKSGGRQLTGRMIS